MEHCMGDCISKARQNRKMTQEEFASRLGVTAAAVSKWERGLGLPDISLLPGICQILHLDANMLLGIEKNRLSGIGKALKGENRGMREYPRYDSYIGADGRGTLIAYFLR